MIRALPFLHARAREAFLRDAFPEIDNPYLRRLARAIEALPDRQHEVFRLARFEGLTHLQIARRLGITEAKVSERFVLALEIIGRSVHRQERRRW